MRGEHKPRALFRRTLLKSAVAAGAVGLAAPFILAARGEAATGAMLYRTLGQARGGQDTRWDLARCGCE